MQQQAGYVSREKSIYKGKIYPQNQNHPQHTLPPKKKKKKKKALKNIFPTPEKCI